jgi:hypothetical protein
MVSKDCLDDFAAKSEHFGVYRHLMPDFRLGLATISEIDEAAAPIDGQNRHLFLADSARDDRAPVNGGQTRIEIMVGRDGCGCVYFRCLTEQDPLDGVTIRLSNK